MSVGVLTWLNGRTRRVVLIAAILACLTLSPAPSPTRAASGVYIGAYIPGAPDLAPVTQFEQQTGKHAAIIEYHLNMEDRPGNHLIDPVYNHGSIPLITWGNIGGCTEITSGSKDADIRWWAAFVRSKAPQPVFLRWGWEMNIPNEFGGYGWGWERCGSDYIAAWRHIHDLLRAERATNVLLTWCPSIIYLGTDPRFNFEQMYPGDAYVDWVCLDGYAKSPVDSPFDVLYGPSLRMMQRVTSKPLLIAELAAGEQAGDGGAAKAAWIRDAFGVQLPKWPQIQAVVWFHSVWEGSAYPVDSSPAALQAFRESVASPYYLSTFETLSAGAESAAGQTNFFADTPQGMRTACPAPTRDAWSSWYWHGETTLFLVRPFSPIVSPESEDRASPTRISRPAADLRPVGLPVQY
jgi:mannan endo-1,4-beta-mannosidase